MIHKWLDVFVPIKLYLYQHVVGWTWPMSSRHWVLNKVIHFIVMVSREPSNPSLSLSYSSWVIWQATVVLIDPGFSFWVEINIPHLENSGYYSKDFIPFMPLSPVWCLRHCEYSTDICWMKEHITLFFMSTQVFIISYQLFLMFYYLKQRWTEHSCDLILMSRSSSRFLSRSTVFWEEL